MTAMPEILRAIYAERSQHQPDQLRPLLGGREGFVTLSDGTLIEAEDQPAEKGGLFYRIEGRIDSQEHIAFISKEALNEAFPNSTDPKHLLLLIAHKISPIRRLLVGDGLIDSLHIDALVECDALPDLPLIRLQASIMTCPVFLTGDEAFGEWMKQRLIIAETQTEQIPDFDVPYQLCISFLRREAMNGMSGDTLMEPGSALRLHSPRDEAVMLLANQAALTIVARPDGAWRIEAIEMVSQEFLEEIFIVESDRGVISSNALTGLGTGDPLYADIVRKNDIRVIQDGRLHSTGRIVEIGGARILTIAAEEGSNRPGLAMETKTVPAQSTL